MNSGGNNSFWFVVLLLLWLQPLGAAQLSARSQQNEFDLAGRSGSAEITIDDSGMSERQQQYLQQQAALDQRPILSGSRLALTPQLQVIERAFAKLMENPADLSPLAFLQQHPVELQAYINRQFYNGTSVSQLESYLKLFALILGDQALPAMIDWGNEFKYRPRLLQGIIRSLALLPANPETRQFIDALLAEEAQHADIIRSAVSYYTTWPHESAWRWVVRYRNRSTPQHTRYLVFYLAALVGDSSIFPRVVDMLKQEPPPYQRYHLRLALSQLVNQAQYRQLTSGMQLPELAAQSILRQIEFRQADPAQRNQLLQAMLSSYYAEERQLAFNHLLEDGDIQGLLQLMRGPEALVVLRRAQQAGIDLANIPLAPQTPVVTAAPPLTEHHAVSAPADNQPVVLILLTLAVTLLLAAIIFLFRRTGTAGIKPRVLREET